MPDPADDQSAQSVVGAVQAAFLALILSRACFSLYASDHGVILDLKEITIQKLLVERRPYRQIVE